MTSRSNDFRPRRGFAMLMAIALIILVGGALAIMGMAFKSEAVRTQLEADQAQLRQLLTFGAASAVAHDSADGERNLTLPPQLVEREAAVTLTSHLAGEVKTVTI